ncbi:MAG: hypothetical protein ABSD62_12310 [Candidatus Limnocylindrales bacterium]|jgi:hypothetical protein
MGHVRIKITLPDGSTVEREVPGWQAEMMLSGLDLPVLSNIVGLRLEVVDDHRD